MSTRSALRNGIDENAERNDRDAVADTRAGGAARWQFSRYDLLLLVLPLPLALGLGWATVTAAPMSAGVSLGSVPTLALLAYSLFVGGPTASKTDPFGE